MVHRNGWFPATLGCVVVCYLAGRPPSSGAEDVIVGTRMAPADRLPLGRISHATWDRLLRRYVNKRGLVDYTAWRKSADDVQVLNSYLQHLSASNGVGSHEAKIAFWINAYNAVTVSGILREYPTSSIRNHTARWIGYNIWKNLKLIVGEQPISLDAMEHQILRKMGEPRIHFAIVCASMGCPRLLDEAYDATRLDKQLTLNAQLFFSDRTKFRYDASSQTFFVSPILDWFGEDFGSTPSARLRRIAEWLPDVDSQQAAAAGKGKMTFVDYDWSLNDQKPR